MEWIELLRINLKQLVTATEFLLEAISVVCVIAGLIKTLQLAIARVRRHRHNTPYPFNKIRLHFGTWLALALEFQLASDILATTIEPTSDELIQLVIIAVIRTFLNYFLGKELEAEYGLDEQKGLATEPNRRSEAPLG